MFVTHLGQVIFSKMDSNDPKYVIMKQSGPTFHIWDCLRTGERQIVVAKNKSRHGRIVRIFDVLQDMALAKEYSFNRLDVLNKRAHFDQDGISTYKEVRILVGARGEIYSS